MGRVCVDSFDVSRIASSGDDRGSGSRVHHGSVPTSYLIENGYDGTNHSGFHTTSKRRSVTRSSISSIYGSTPRPSFSSYPFSRTDSFSSAATSSYSNVFEDEKPALGADHEDILEQDGDDDEDEDEDGDEDDEGANAENGDDGIHWNDTNEESYIENEFEDDAEDDEDAGDDDDDDDDDAEDDDDDEADVGAGQAVSLVAAGLHKSSSLRSQERIVIYRCKSCYCDVCISSLIISKDFWGNKGEAYFVKDVLNVREDAKEVMKHMRTGQYGVKSIYCVQCDTVIGWKYITSIEPVEKYKVGKYVIEKNLLKTYKVPDCAS